MKRIAVFPGSFDPITLGHTSVIKRAIPLFDEIIVAIGTNSQKQYMFDLSRRKQWLKDCFAKEPTVTVEVYQGLTVNFCEEKNARFILRGLRDMKDFNFEHTIAQMNREMNDEIETVFILTELKYAAINSSVVRDIIRNNGDVSSFLPEEISIK